MIVILRILPAVAALVVAVSFSVQLRTPLQYPWLATIGVCAFLVATLAISWGRVRFVDMLEKMTPTSILILALGFAMLLAEGSGSKIAIVVLAGFTAFVSLELLFLLAFNPTRYPVHGLSRVNIAYVPIAIWYVACTSAGMLIFLHMDRLWHILIMVLLGTILFRTTGHPQASWKENATWSAVGALVGGHVGLLGIMLPVSMPVQGFVAAFLLSAALRVRRYRYDPKPSVRQGWIEAVAGAVALVAVLTTGKWL
ncbi:hypothetical protein KJ781_02500 [Patescibacteria group bacterium]|nr:hypothetical protein [Patescibacteria group bacterium]MBU1448712.1 hypothetical protein [Patescibacteria group bacterium]MBU2613694.1 hypothetical protein [Patescibacteria group bacterium]